jgi:hypothetical protein
VTPTLLPWGSAGPASSGSVEPGTGLRATHRPCSGPAYGVFEPFLDRFQTRSRTRRGHRPRRYADPTGPHCGVAGGGPAWARIQACIAMPLATPALIERVEPYWAMEKS